MRQAWGVLFLVVLAAATACTPPIAATIDRLDTTITIQPDGSARIEERMLVPAGSAGAMRYERTLERLDGVADAVVLLDERPLAATQVDTSEGLHVDWSPAQGSPSVLTLRYSATGAVAVRGGHATFFWRPLPMGQFTARAIRVSLILPTGSQLTGDPWLEGVHWSTAREGSVLTFEHGELPVDRPAAIVVAFSVDTRSMLEPQWQIDAERGSDLVPAFISAGLFILIVAAGVLIMVRLQYPRAARADSLDPARAAVARALRIAGIVTLVFGLMAWPVVEWTLGHFGAWPHAMSVSIIVSGLLMLVFGARKEI